ncbi:MAG: collagen-like protein [Thermoleophilaceae bacterium]
MSRDSLEQRVLALENELAGRRRGGRALQSLAAALVLTALTVPLALAGEAPRKGSAAAAGNERGEAVQIGLRNRSERETGLIASGDGYSLRLSNVNRGEGGGAIFGCRAAASAAESCVNADNLADGQAFFFRSREGSSAGRFQVDGPNAVPFTTNAGGLVANLNADKVDGLDAAQLRGLQGPAGPAGPQGEAGAPGPAGAQGAPGEPATRLLAAVESACTGLDRSVGALSVNPVTGSQCRIRFDRDISRCYAFVANRNFNLQTTILTASIGGPDPANGDGDVAGGPGQDEVAVLTTDSTDGLAGGTPRLAVTVLC